MFSPSFLWFYLFDAALYDSILNLTGDLLWVYTGRALFYVSISVFAIIGSFLNEKWRRRSLFKYTILIGIASTASLAIFQGLIPFLLLGVLAGVSFGLGFPLSLAFLADSTTIEERARVSGVAIFATFVSLVASIVVATSLEFGLQGRLFLAVFIRATSLIVLSFDPCERGIGRQEKWKTVFSTQGFWLYFASWLMFNLAGSIFGFIKLPPSLDLETISDLGAVFNFVGVVSSALVSGFVSDRFGRKKTIIFGLIILGISYGSFGIVTSTETYLFTRIIYGAAWGIILVTYGLTVIGDLAATFSKEKFYAIGVIVPLFLFSFSQIFSDALKIEGEASLISSILSMVLFVAVIPLLYAPETLPSDKVARRKLKEHLEKVKKLVEKE